MSNHAACKECHGIYIIFNDQHVCFRSNSHPGVGEPQNNPPTPCTYNIVLNNESIL